MSSKTAVAAAFRKPRSAIAAKWWPFPWCFDFDDNEGIFVHTTATLLLLLLSPGRMRRRDLDVQEVDGEFTRVMVMLSYGNYC